MAQVRFNISLSEQLKEQLQADAKAKGVASSKLISQYVEEHYNAKPAEESSAVIVGLQHELELTKTNMKNLSEQVVDLKGQIHDLKADKENLQKQLELVTLRLPAPKEGFWSRVFGRRKKEQEAQP